jgi:hypothetical protein
MRLADYFGRTSWSLFEAACLLAGTVPNEYSAFWDPVTKARFQVFYANLKDATDWGHLRCFGSRTGHVAQRRVIPWDVVAWANARGDEIPEELSAEAKPKVEPNAVGTTSAEEESSTAECNTPQFDSLGARERESLLKMVIAMAVRGYKYDPSANRSKITQEIADDLRTLGLSLDVDTVRKYLKSAAVLLRNKP